MRRKHSYFWNIPSIQQKNRDYWLDPGTLLANVSLRLVASQAPTEVLSLKVSSQHLSCSWGLTVQFEEPSSLDVVDSCCPVVLWEWLGPPPSTGLCFYEEPQSVLNPQLLHSHAAEQLYQAVCLEGQGYRPLIPSVTQEGRSGQLGIFSMKSRHSPGF